MSGVSRWMPTALGSARSLQPAALAAFETVGANDGAGPSPKPTLEPRMNLLGSIDLIESVPSGVVVAGVVPAAATVAAAASSPAEEAVVELELPLLEPQPASTSTPASSASARRAVTPRTLEPPRRPGLQVVLQEAVDEREPG